MQDQIKEKRKEKWFEVQFVIEALAINKEMVEKSLKAHIDKMDKLKDVLVCEKQFLETIKVEHPMKGIDEAYSQVAKVSFFAKNMVILLSMVMAYGPSSVEILGPERHEVKAEEAQNISNLLAGVVHQFAAAGLGGMIITPDKQG
jgi:hypothetical protein